MSVTTVTPNELRVKTKPAIETPVSVLVWRGYLMQRRRGILTELAEIENILQQIAELGVDKAPG